MEFNPRNVWAELVQLWASQAIAEISLISPFPLHHNFNLYNNWPGQFNQDPTFHFQGFRPGFPQYKCISGQAWFVQTCQKYWEWVLCLV